MWLFSKYWLNKERKKERKKNSPKFFTLTGKSMRPNKSKRQYRNFANLLKIRKKINPLNRLTKE